MLFPLSHYVGFYAGVLMNTQNWLLSDVCWMIHLVLGLFHSEWLRCRFFQLGWVWWQSQWLIDFVVLEVFLASVVLVFARVLVFVVLFVLVVFPVVALFFELRCSSRGHICL